MHDVEAKTFIKQHHVSYKDFNGNIISYMIVLGRRWSPMPFLLPGTPFQVVISAIQSWIHIIWIPVLNKNKCKISHLQIVHLFIYSFSAYVLITISVEIFQDGKEH